MSVIYRSTKTFGHEVGFSAAFRQWRADSHCRFVHGYALAIRVEFEAEVLDGRNWVVDFGDMKGLKAILAGKFDHKTLVARDDPELAWFRHAHSLGVIDLVEVSATGCERFAEMVFDMASEWLRSTGYAGRVWVARVEVSEHGANSAVVVPA